MKKFIFALACLLSVSLLFSGCMVSFRSNQSASGSSDKKLTFCVTKEMQEKGITPENTESVKVLRDLIASNPKIGAENDFSILYSGKQGDSNGKKFVTFFAVNKTDHTLKNISLKLTMKVGDDYVIKEQEVTLPEQSFGTISSYTAMPVSIVLKDDSYTLLDKATNDNVSLSVTDFKSE